jgi:hypothetical protein
LGVEKSQDFSGVNCALRILAIEGVLEADKAHTQAITDIEMTKMGETFYFFTSSLDGSIKAWVIGPDGKSLVMYANKQLGGKRVLKLVMC